MQAIVHRAGVPSVPRLNETMVKTLLRSADTLAEFPELKPVAGQLAAALVPKPGKCGGCARRSSEAAIVVEAMRVVASLPKDRIPRLKAILGVPGPLRVWVRIGPSVSSVTI